MIHDELGTSLNPFDRVVHGLYQASSALDPLEFFELGFDAVFDLCGWERDEHMDGQAYRFYLIDDVPWIPDPGAIEELAGQIADLVRADRRVVVNCSAGLNRSGLLVGRALVELGHTPAEAVELVRRARGPRALSNVAFTKFPARGLHAASAGGTTGSRRSARMIGSSITHPLRTRRWSIARPVGDRVRAP